MYPIMNMNDFIGKSIITSISYDEKEEVNFDREYGPIYETSNFKLVYVDINTDIEIHVYYLNCLKSWVLSQKVLLSECSKLGSSGWFWHYDIIQMTKNELLISKMKEQKNNVVKKIYQLRKEAERKYKEGEKARKIFNENLLILTRRQNVINEMKNLNHWKMVEEQYPGWILTTGGRL